MGEDIVRLIEPGPGAQFGKNERFDFEAQAQWPPGFIQGSGLWQAKHGGPWFDLGASTMIKSLEQNPFPVNGQMGVIHGEGETSTYKGHFDLRLMILDDQMQEYTVSNVVGVTVGLM